MLKLSAQAARFRSAQRSRCKLPFPAEPKLRIAQISAGSVLFSAQPFLKDQWDALPLFRPGVLLGSAADLQLLAGNVKRGLNDVSSVDRAIFVVTQCGDQPVSDVSRVVLWQTFGVPVYELLVGAGGLVLASECQAQEGWHVEEGVTFSLLNRELVANVGSRKRLFTGLTARLETELCPCGRAGMRLMEVEMLASNANQRQLAATA